MFTGDRSGDWLFAALHRAGLANQPTSLARDDGLGCTDAYVTAAVRCAPPGNKPDAGRARRCLPYLVRELELLRACASIVALGAFAWDGALRLLARSARRRRGRSPASATAPRRRRRLRCSAAITRASRTRSPAGSPSRCSTRCSSERFATAREGAYDREPVSGIESQRSYLRLTELLGAPVRDGSGRQIGRVADLVVSLDDTFPPVTGVLVRARRGTDPRVVPVAAVQAIGTEGVVLAGPLAPGDEVADDLLLLGRDVLDVQVVDAASRALARVGDVDLATERRRPAAVRRRRRLARDPAAPGSATRWRGAPHATRWTGPDCTSPAVRATRCSSPRPPPPSTASTPPTSPELLARLPVMRGGEVLETVASARGAAALATVHPELGADLVEVLTPERALRLLEQMPDAEAADALREADEERRAGPAAPP